MTLSEAEAYLFKAEIVHNPRGAERKLRRYPSVFVGPAVELVRNADRTKRERATALLHRLVARPEDQILNRLIFDTIHPGMPGLNTVVIRAGRFIVRTRRLLEEADRIDRANLWIKLSEHHQEAGQPRSGLTCARRAVRLLRRMVSENRDHLNLLILALQVLAKSYSDNGHHEKAIAMALEAVDRAFHSFEKANAEAMAKAKTAMAYIGALDTLTVRLSLAGELTQALQEGAKVHELVRELFPNSPSMLASARYRLASVLNEMEQVEQALPLADAARETFQQLAHEFPNSWEKLYYAANDLVVGARSVLGLPPHNEALRGESRAFFEQRARENPGANLPRLMCYLTRDSAVMDNAGQHEQALALAEQAASVARQVRSHYGNQRALEEAKVHLHLATLHRKRGDNEAAKKAAREACRRSEMVPTAPGIEQRLACLEFMAGIEQEPSTASAKKPALLIPTLPRE